MYNRNALSASINETAFVESERNKTRHVHVAMVSLENIAIRAVTFAGLREAVKRKPNSEKLKNSSEVI